MRISHNPQVRDLQMKQIFRADQTLFFKHISHDIKSCNIILPKLSSQEIINLKSYLIDYKPLKGNDLSTKFLNLRDAFLTLNHVAEDSEKELIKPILKYLQQYKPIFDMIINNQHKDKIDINLKLALEMLNFEINLFCIRYGRILLENDSTLTINTNTLQREPEEEAKE
jgi:hypothetical protein